MRKILLSLTIILAFNTLNADILTDTCRFKKDSENILTTKFTEISSQRAKLKKGDYAENMADNKGIMLSCQDSFDNLGFKTSSQIRLATGSLSTDSSSYCVQYYNFMEFVENIENKEKKEAVKLAYMVFTNRLTVQNYKNIVTNSKSDNEILGYAFAYNFKEEMYKDPLSVSNLPSLNFSSYTLKRDNKDLNLGSQDPLYVRYTTSILTGDFDTTIKILLKESNYKDYVDNFKDLCKKIEKQKTENIKEYTGNEVKDLLIQNKDLLNYYTDITNNSKCYNSKNKLEVENNEDFISKFFTNFDNTTQAVLLKDIYTKQDYIEIMYNNNIYKFYEDKKLCETQKNR